MSTLPDFLIIGATKCGTTSLHRYLTDHPQVFIHPTKELRFFTAEHHWDRGVDWYREQFASVGSAKAIGEATNSYTRYPTYEGVPERIHAVLPNARLIYMIRHPVERMASHYRHRLATGIEWRDPDGAVSEDPRYVSTGLYGSQIDRYLRCFPREQILCLRLEDLKASPADTLARVCRFLDIDASPQPEFPRLNVTADRVVVPAVLRSASRWKPARGLVKAVARRIRRSPWGERSGRADAAVFALSPAKERELEALFAQDLALLSRLLDEPFPRWETLPAPAP